MFINKLKMSFTDEEKEKYEDIIKELNNRYNKLDEAFNMGPDISTTDWKQINIKKVFLKNLSMQ